METIDPHVTIAAPISRAVALSGISRSTIYRLAGEGRIRILKIGRTSLVDMASVRAFLNTLPEARISAPDTPLKAKPRDAGFARESPSRPELTRSAA